MSYAVKCTECGTPFLESEGKLCDCSEHFEIDDRDHENPFEYTEGYDWSKHNFDNDSDWR